MSTSTTAPESQPAKKRGLFGCLLSLLVGAFAFVIALILILIWIAGTRVPLGLVSTAVNQKSGGELTFGENDTNFFAGRVHWKNVTLTNPSRFSYKNFFTLNEMKAEVKPFSATGDVIEIPEVILDIGEVSLVAAGKIDLAGILTGDAAFLKDNNVMDFKKAFAPESAPEATESKPEESKSPGAPIRFHIGKLTLKFGTFRLVENGATPGATASDYKSVPIGLNLAFTDVTESNWTTSVLPVVQKELEKALGFSLGGLLDMGEAALNKLVDEAKARAQQAFDEAKAKAEKAAADARAKIEAEAAKLQDKGAEAVNNAAAKANDAVTKATDDASKKLGGLLGGLGKKKEEPKPEEPAK